MKPTASLCALICLTSALALMPTALAEVHVWVEPLVVDELDTMQLNIRATDTQQADTPDLSVLEANFEILGSQTTSQRRSVNGNVESWVDYQYSLRAKRSGELTIPPIRVGSQTSAATQVIVRALDANVKLAIERMVFFETELTVDPVYVQAQTVYVRRLYYASGVQLYSDLPGIPDVPNAVIVPLGDTRSSTTLVEGTRYGVIEQRFAIFPEQSGVLSVPEASITSSVRLRRGGRTRRSGIRITAPAQSVTVVPIPTEYPPGTPWLPAADVQLIETWTPNRATIELGDPIIRSIAITAVGNTGSAIPPLRVDFPSQHLKHYPEAPSLDDDASTDQVIGNRIEAYSLIPTTPGSAQLAPISVTWWDTTAHRVRSAHLPARLLRIQGTLPAAPSPAAPAREPEAAIGAAATANPDADTGLQLPAVVLAVGGSLVLIATIGWLARSLIPRLPQRASTKWATPSRRRALGALKLACRDSDIVTMRRRLLQLMEVIYQAPEATALPLFLEQPQHAALWRRLNAAAYGPASEATGTSESATLSGELWQLARRLKAPKSKTSGDSLPPLYATGD